MQLPSILQHKSFRDLWLGQTVSQFGDAVYMLVFVYVAEKVSGDAKMVGLVAVLEALPFVIFGPFAGVLADSIDRRKILVVAEFSAVLILAGLAIYTWFDPWPSIPILATSAFLLSTVNSVFAPARSASIPRLVPEGKVQEAIGFALTTEQFMWFVGLAVSAPLLGLIDKIASDRFFFIAVSINAVTFLVSTSFLRRLPEIIPLREVRDKARGAISNIMADIKEGFKTIGSDIVIKLALPMSVIVNLFVSGFLVIYVTVNSEWFDGTYGKLAWIELSFMAVSMIMSLILTKKKIKRPGFAFAMGNIAIGLCILAMAWSTNYWVFMLTNALCGLAFPFIMIPINAYLQTAIPDGVRGRVNSTWGMVASAVRPIGIAVVAALLAWQSIMMAFIVMGLGTMLGGLIGVFSKKFMNTTMPESELEAETQAT